MENNIENRVEDKLPMIWPWLSHTKRDEPLSLAWRKGLLIGTFALLLILVVYMCIHASSVVIPIVMVVALIGAMVALRSPAIAMVFVFGGAGIPEILLPIPGHTMRMVELALFLCCLIIVLRLPSIRLRAPHLFALAFLAIAVISYIHVPARSTGLDSYGADKRLYEILLLVLALFCGTFLSTETRRISTLLCAVLVINAPFYLVGLAQMLHIPIPSLLVIQGQVDATPGRIYGPTTGAATFGIYLINLYGVAIACWLTGEHKWHRWFGAGMTLLMALLIIESGTRSAAIAIVIITILPLIMTKRFWLLILSSIAATAAALPFLPKIMNLFDSHGAASNSNRIFLWTEALKLISSHPWMGIGLQQFYVYYNQLIIDLGSKLNGNGISIHEQYLEYAMESGIVWLIIALILLFSIIFICWHAFKHVKKKEQTIFLATLLVVVGNMIAGFFDVPLDKAEGGVFVFMLAGIALGYLQHLQESHRFNIQTPKLALRSQTLAFSRAVYAKRPLAIGHPVNTQQNVAMATAIHAANDNAEDIESLPTISLRKSHVIIDADTQLLPLAPFRKGHASIAEDIQPLPQVYDVGIAEDLKDPPGKENDAKDDKDDKDDHPPTAKKTGRTIALQLICWGISIPIIFPVTALLTRYLGPIQYGEYSFTSTYLPVFALLSGTGMDALIVRQLSRTKRKEWSNVLSYALGTRLLSTSVSILLAIIVAFFMPVNSEGRTLLLIGSLTLFFSFSFNGASTIFAHGFTTEQRAGVIFVIGAADRIVTAGLVALIVLLHIPLVPAYTILVFSDLPFCILEAIIAYKRYHLRPRLKLKLAYKQFFGSLSLTGYDALALINGQVDVLLLLVIAGPLSVGIYALAMRLTDPLLSISFAYFGGVYPLLCKKFEEGKTQFSHVYQESVRTLALGIIPLSIIINVEAGTLVSWLGGPRYVSAIPAVRLLMIATTISFFYGLAVRTCTAANLERRTPIITFISTSVNVILNLILIPHIQFVGCAIAAVSSEVVGWTLYSLTLRKHVYLWRIYGAMLRVLLGNLPMLAFLLWQQQLSVFITVPIGLIICLLGCLLTRAFLLKDLTLLVGMVTRRRAQHVPGDHIADHMTMVLPRIEDIDISSTPTIVMPRIRP